jgi:hypothetical protein
MRVVRQIFMPLSKSEWVGLSSMTEASLCSAGAHLSVPAYTNVKPSRAVAVKNGRFFSGRPQGLFLTAASTAAC